MMESKKGSKKGYFAPFTLCHCSHFYGEAWGKHAKTFKTAKMAVFDQNDAF
ncbi:hypothetical protein LF599_06575 [Pseudodesulfovibrio thermohalotolerans]|uniref:hypothetical protein n=1 Tax=Pseudodesulfovibrio thermohalotolerans TaxID=2880651 RepID=UPI0024414535|nr:hypothetical protein [Pseudodesulfovibrio thermohalotolerans]WFS63823.1 hypothetical protein LF599_06575 [Pseudodesulfovibrio thermohalotolerans]